MRCRIIHGHSFGLGGGVEVVIRRNQRQWPETGILLESLDFEGDCQLHGVLGSKPVLAGHRHCVAKQVAGQLDDAVAMGKMPAEMPEDRSGLGG